MCFDRIDGTAKRLNRAKMSPAQKNSLWSELNKEHCRRMKKLKLMTGAGRAVLPDMSPAGFVVDGEILSALKKDER